MKNESDILMMNNIIGDLGDTGNGDKSSKSIYLNLCKQILKNLNPSRFLNWL